MDDRRKLGILSKTARALREAGVRWALGASAMLYFNGLVETYHDFDLLIAKGDMPATQAVFTALGAKALPPAPVGGDYATAEFRQYTLGGMGFDLLCGFAVRRDHKAYPYPFDETRVAGYAQALTERVPLAPLADWWVLYQLMRGREEKAALLERYLRAHPDGESRALLGQWLRRRLPSDIRERVMQLYRAMP